MLSEVERSLSIGFVYGFFCTPDIVCMIYRIYRAKDMIISYCAKLVDDPIDLGYMLLYVYATGYMIYHQTDILMAMSEGDFLSRGSSVRFAILIYDELSRAALCIVLDQVSPSEPFMTS